MMKNLFKKQNLLLLLFLGAISFMQAQTQFANVSARVIRVTHNSDCTCDGGAIVFGTCIGGGNPEPRWRIRTRPSSGTFGPVVVVNPGTVGCGNINRNDALASYTNLCDPQLVFEITSWEDDGCGSDNTYDTGCANNDNNLSSATTYTFNYQPPNTPGTSFQDFAQSNGGYSVRIEITWTVASVLAAPTISGTTTVCPGGSVSLTASSAGATTYNWYSVATGGTPVSTGAVYNQSNINTSTTVYVAASNGTCEGPRTAVPITVTPPPAAPAASGVTICTGSTATLTTTGTNPRWYSDVSLSSLVFTGSPFTTPALMTNTTYYVTQTTTCQGAGTAVLVTVLPPPSPPTAQDDEFCANENVILTATGAGTINWYNAPTGGTLVGTGASFNAGLLAVGTYTFYASATVGTCTSTRDAAIIQVKPIPTNVTPGATPTICSGNSATLSASGTGDIYWYADAGLTNLLQVGNTFVTQPLTTSTTFYATNVVNGCSSPAFSFTVIVNPTPGQPTASGTTICEGQTATLTATGVAGATFTWYSDASGNSQVGTGASFTTPVLNSSTTYYVRQTTSPQGCPGPLRAVTVTVTPLPTAPTVIGGTFCQGANVIITANGTGNGGFKFYNVANGGTALSTVNGPVASGTYNAGALAPGTYTYYVSEFNTCESPRTSVLVTVLPTPASPVAAGTTICSGQTATLIATGSGVVWYDATQTNVLNVGNAFTTPVLNTTTTYLAVVQANGCTSIPTSVVVTVNPTPGQPTASGTTICEGQTATLTATGVAGATFTWYSDASGNTQVGTGASFTTPVLNSSTTYYVRQTTSPQGCASSLRAVMVTVTPLPTSPTVVGGTFCQGANVIITANGTGNGGFKFYNVANGGTALSTVNGPVASGTYNAGALAPGTYTYYVSEFNTCESPRTSVLVTVLPTPASPVAAGAIICSGQAATLLATGSGVVWYDATQTNVLNVGNAFTTPVLNTTTIYLAVVQANGCTSLPTTVTVTVNALPTGTATTGATICAGQTATVSVTGAAGSSFVWYADQNGNTQVGTGVSFTTPVLYNTATYYVRETNSSNCNGSLVAAVVNVSALSPAPQVTGGSFCEGSDVIVSAIGSGNGGFSIYANNNPATVALQNVAGPVPSATFNLGALAAGSYIYYVSQNENCESVRVPVSVVVQPAPIAPVVSNTSVCAGEQAILTATASGVIYWYADASLTTLLATGNILTVNNVTTTANYYAVSFANGCYSVASTGSVTVLPLPSSTAINASPVAVCAGGTSLLTVTGDPGSTFGWFADAAGTVSVSSSATFTTPALYTSTTYFAIETNSNGCAGNAVAVTIAVNQLPAAPAASGISLCLNETGVITAAGSGTGTLIWYDAAMTSLQVNNMPPASANFNVGPFGISGTNVFYVSQNNGQCESNKTPIAVNVLTPTAAPTVSGATICAGETATISASGNGIIYWYDAPTGGNFLAAGSSYTTSALTSNTTFYVSNEVNGCESNRVAVNITVNPAPSLTGTIGNNSPLCEGESLQLSSPAVAGATYHWTGPNGWTSNAQNPVIMNVSENDTQGFYTLVLEGANGCFSQPYITIVEVNALPQSVSVFNNSPICEGNDLVISTTDVFGGSYAWSGPNGFAANTQTISIPAATANVSGSYTVTVSIGNCSANPVSTLVQINPTPNVDAGADITTEQGVVTPLLATGAVTYIWSPSFGLDNPNVPNPTLIPVNAGTFTYQVTGYNQYGCSGSDQVTVNVNAQNNLEIVDLITPNGDGINEYLVIKYLENIGEYTLSIYNRQGQELYTTNSYNNDWNAVYENKNLPDGTYWYVISTAARDYKGAVTVKR